jgi:hypothetical protein
VNLVAPDLSQRGAAGADGGVTVAGAGFRTAEVQLAKLRVMKANAHACARRVLVLIKLVLDHIRLSSELVCVDASTPD